MLRRSLKAYFEEKEVEESARRPLITGSYQASGKVDGSKSVVTGAEAVNE